MAIKAGESLEKEISFEKKFLKKQLVIVAIILLMTILLFSLYIFLKEKQHLDTKIENSIGYMTDILPIPLWNIQEDEVYLIGETFFQDSIVLQISITDLSREKTIINMVKDESLRGIVRKVDITFNNRIIGQVEILFSRREIISQLLDFLIFSLFISLFIVISIIVINRMIFKSDFIKPIDKFMRIISSYSEDQLNTDSDSIEYTEFKPLLDVFNDMKREIVKENAERIQNLEALQKREEDLKTILDSIADGVIAADVECKITGMNRVAEELTGYSFRDAIGKDLTEIYRIGNSATGRPLKNPVEKVLDGEVIQRGTRDTILISRDGTNYQISDSAAPIENKEGKILGIVIAFSDITEEKELQKILNHKNRMDAIGQLAGGMAHDFNNMLGGIMNSAQLLKSPKRNLDEKGRKYVDIIVQASQRAADLTSKLLSFGRMGATKSTTVDLHRLIEETVAILERTVDKKINISMDNNAKKYHLIGDSSELQNAILNLCINSSQALPEGGDIKISTRNVQLSETYCNISTFDIEPGPYCEIEINDTGCGIPAEYLQKIFEPFFTTKGVNHGTGLGLSAVYGTVQSHHGAISVYSEVGSGTSFRVKLPCSATDEIEDFSIDEQLLRGSETILVVDDEELILVTVEEMLISMGYNVISAKNGQEAVKIFSEKHSDIDLVLMDMIMPVMNGREAFDEMYEIDPECKVIISSGFTKDENPRELKERGLAGFIRKPYRDYELSQLLAHSLKNQS